MSTHDALKNFEQIYEDTYNVLLNFIICKCSNLDDVNDILQDVYLDLYKILEKEKNIDDYRNFVIGIAKNKIKKYFSLKNKIKSISIFQQVDDEEIIIDIDAKIDLESEFINKNNIDQIWKYLKIENINLAKIFYLYFVQEVTFKEIARELNMNESTVKSRLYRMLKKLKIIFGGDIYNVR